MFFFFKLLLIVGYFYSIFFIKHEQKVFKFLDICAFWYVKAVFLLILRLYKLTWRFFFFTLNWVFFMIIEFSMFWWWEIKLCVLVFYQDNIFDFIAWFGTIGHWRAYYCYLFLKHKYYSRKLLKPKFDLFTIFFNFIKTKLKTKLNKFSELFNFIKTNKLYVFFVFLSAITFSFLFWYFFDLIFIICCLTLWQVVIYLEYFEPTISFILDILYGLWLLTLLVIAVLSDFICGLFDLLLAIADLFWSIGEYILSLIKYIVEIIDSAFEDIMDILKDLVEDIFTWCVETIMYVISWLIELRDDPRKMYAILYQLCVLFLIYWTLRPVFEIARSSRFYRTLRREARVMAFFLKNLRIKDSIVKTFNKAYMDFFQKPKPVINKVSKKRKKRRKHVPKPTIKRVFSKCVRFIRLDLSRRRHNLLNYIEDLLVFCDYIYFRGYFTIIVRLRLYRYLYANYIFEYVYTPSLLCLFTDLISYLWESLCNSRFISSISPYIQNLSGSKVYFFELNELFFWLNLNRSVVFLVFFSSVSIFFFFYSNIWGLFLGLLKTYVPFFKNK